MRPKFGRGNCPGGCCEIQMRHSEWANQTVLRISLPRSSSENLLFFDSLHRSFRGFHPRIRASNPCAVTSSPTNQTLRDCPRTGALSGPSDFQPGRGRKQEERPHRGGFHPDLTLPGGGFPSRPQPGSPISQPPPPIMSWRFSGNLGIVSLASIRTPFPLGRSR